MLPLLTITFAYIALGLSYYFLWKHIEEITDFED